MSLHLALADYDGKQVATLEEIRDSRAPTPEVLDEVIRISTAADGHVAAGATWLLRAWVEAGAVLTKSQMRALTSRLPEVNDPWARLHLCQTVRSLNVEPAHAEAFAGFLRSCRSSDRPFLRAWATDGLHALASAHPEYGAEATEAVEDALGDPAASVRARARRILDGR